MRGSARGKVSRITSPLAAEPHTGRYGLGPESAAAETRPRLATLAGRTPFQDPAANAAHISSCTGWRGVREGFGLPGIAGAGGLRGMAPSQVFGAAPGQAERVGGALVGD